jgi:Major Facilitator Superfamily
MSSPNDIENIGPKRRKWCVGVLNEKSTDEVPGSVVLLSKTSTHNAPLGLDNIPARTSRSSLPPPFLTPASRQSSRHSSISRTSKSARKKKTPDGKIVLNPQPEDSKNDPLNWPFWKRNTALLCLGFYCCIGGGVTPILAAGFTNVAQTFNVPVAKVALTTGLYMLGLGVGGVIMSPTAIILGKRPVYLATAILFILASVWCALSPNYGSLVAARIFQGIAVSPVEVLPSATVAEIFFLHERAFRLGIYTLLLLSGKNLIPLISAVIIQEAGWRWVFWLVLPSLLTSIKH